jgi:hypothetical protein
MWGVRQPYFEEITPHYHAPDLPGEQGQQTRHTLCKVPNHSCTAAPAVAVHTQQAPSRLKHHRLVADQQVLCC